jgi:2-C-methyl-D-erythritol 4-phosphate cytidylyltransferase
VSAAAVIVAAGAGQRFKSRVPKQFLSLRGLPVFLWSVLAFRQVPAFSQIIVVVPAGRAALLKRYRKAHDITIVSGGQERYDSVRAGLAALRDDIRFVAVHDAARPLITPALIAAGLSAAKKYGASVVAVPARDTVKRASGDLRVRETVPRNEIWLAQTPQTFRREILVGAYRARATKGITDDAQMLERAGRPVRIVPGDMNNMKITEPGDLELAALLLKQRKK